MKKNDSRRWPTLTGLVLVTLLTMALTVFSVANASLPPSKVFTASAKKLGAYVEDGVITGGDQAISRVVIKGFRFAQNSGFDRMVIDLEGMLDGEPAAISRAPYFQVAVSPEEERVVFTIWGKPKLDFDAQKAVQAFKKSAAVRSVEILPRLDDDSWTFVLSMQPGHSIEVFELGSPVRIIADIRTSAGVAGKSRNPSSVTQASRPSAHSARTVDIPHEKPYDVRGDDDDEVGVPKAEEVPTSL